MSSSSTTIVTVGYVDFSNACGSITTSSNPTTTGNTPNTACQLTTTLQAVDDGVAPQGESWTDFAVGFADEFAPQLQHNRALLWPVYKEKTRPSTALA